MPKPSREPRAQAATHGRAGTKHTTSEDRPRSRFGQGDDGDAVIRRKALPAFARLALKKWRLCAASRVEPRIMIRLCTDKTVQRFFVF